MSEQLVSMQIMFIYILWIISSVKCAVDRPPLSVLKWNKHLQDFQPITGLPSFEDEEKKISPTKHHEETHNFKGDPLYLTHYEEPNFVEFYDNDTKVRGIYGELWTLLSKTLNFTLVVRKIDKNQFSSLTLKNGGNSATLDAIRKENQTDIIPRMVTRMTKLKGVRFTVSFWKNNFRIYEVDNGSPNRTWILDVLPSASVPIICVFMVMLSLASIIAQKLIKNRGLLGEELPDLSYFDHFFSTFATLCHQGHARDTSVNSYRIISITTSFFSWILLSFFTSHLVYIMTHNVYKVHWTDFESLYANTNLQVVVLNDSLAHKLVFDPNARMIFKLLKTAKRVKVATNVDDLYRTICLDSKNFVIYDIEAEVSMRDNINTCQIRPAGLFKDTVHFCSGVSKRVKHKKAIDIQIIKFRNFGVTEKIKKQYLDRKQLKPPKRKDDNVVIGFDRVSLIFAIVPVGMIASIIILIAENVLSVVHMRKKTQHLIQRFRAINRTRRIY